VVCIRITTRLRRLLTLDPGKRGPLIQ